MKCGKRILAVVPARGGSKGIKLKNLSKVYGKSLIEWVADCIRNLEIIDKCIVSTDHEGIANESRRVGIDVPFIRPEHLSGDRVADVDVLTHALYQMEDQNRCIYDVILMLQPTSPMRKDSHLKDVLDKLIGENFDSVLTLSKTDLWAHPLKQLLLDNGRISYYAEEGKNIVARQQLKPTYHRNGIAYAITRKCLTDQKTTIGENCGAVIIDEEVVNIDSLDDLCRANELIKKRGG